MKNPERQQQIYDFKQEIIALCLKYNVTYDIWTEKEPLSPADLAITIFRFQ